MIYEVNGIKLDIHFQNKDEVLNLICKRDKEVEDIAQITLNKGIVKAKINCNYFNNNPSSKEYGQSYGVRQGIDDDGLVVDEAPKQKEWLVVWINKGNEVNVNYSNYYWLTAKEVTCAFSPALVILHKGEITNEYISTGQSKRSNTLTNQSFFMKMEDGRFAIGITHGKITATDLGLFAKSIGATHLSTLDSGGSTQMIEYGDKIEYTGRKIKDVLAFIKDDNASNSDTNEPQIKSKEVAMYPCPWVHITQNSFTSEKGTHMNTYAIDLVGKERYARLYAPVTMKVVAINKNSKSSEIIFHSCDEQGNDETKLLIDNATGQFVETLLSFRFVHKVDVEMFAIGKIFKQGEYCYNTGTRGMGGANSLADHCHIEVAIGLTQNVRLTDPRPSVQGQNLIGAIKPERHLSLDKNIHKISPTSSDAEDGARGNNLIYIQDVDFNKYLECLEDKQMTLRHEIGGTVLQWLKKGDKFLVNEVIEKQKDGYRYAKVLGGVIQIDEDYIKLVGFEDVNPNEKVIIELSKQAKLLEEASKAIAELIKELK